jgi:hypothetical protein
MDLAFQYASVIGDEQEDRIYTNRVIEFMEYCSPNAKNTKVGVQTSDGDAFRTTRDVSMDPRKRMMF